MFTQLIIKQKKANNEGVKLISGEIAVATKVVRGFSIKEKDRSLLKIST